MVENCTNIIGFFIKLKNYQLSFCNLKGNFIKGSLLLRYFSVYFFIVCIVFRKRNDVVCMTSLISGTGVINDTNYHDSYWFLVDTGLKSITTIIISSLYVFFLVSVLSPEIWRRDHSLVCNIIASKQTGSTKYHDPYWVIQLLFKCLLNPNQNTSWSSLIRNNHIYNLLNFLKGDLGQSDLLKVIFKISFRSTDIVNR